MLIKSIIATLAGAAVTGGAVYVAQNPEILEPAKTEQTSDTADQSTLSETLPNEIMSDEAVKAADSQSDPEASNDDDRGEEIRITIPVVEVGRETKVQQSGKRSAEVERTEISVKADAPEGEKTSNSDRRDAQNARRERTRANREAERRRADPEGRTSSLDDTVLDDTVEVEDTVELEQTVDLPDTLGLTDESIAEIHGELSALNAHREKARHQADTSTLTYIDRVLTEADKIESLEWRDQAYLDVVDYALMRDEFSNAISVAERLSDDALRDTARNRIAVKYALAGDMDSAFATIETVENDSLRDFMRLQVIEALTVPERLPEGVVPR